MNAAFQAAKEKLDARRAARQASDYRPPVSSRHQNLKLAQRYLGSGDKSDVELWLVIRYCEDCKRGTPIDVVRQPGDLPDARAMELRQLRPWRLECTEN